MNDTGIKSASYLIITVLFICACISLAWIVKRIANKFILHNSMKLKLLKVEENFLVQNTYN